MVVQWSSVPVLKTVKFFREEETATEGTLLVQLHCSQAFTACLLPDCERSRGHSRLGRTRQGALPVQWQWRFLSAHLMLIPVSGIFVPVKIGKV